MTQKNENMLETYLREVDDQLSIPSTVIGPISIDEEDENLKINQFELMLKNDLKPNSKPRQTIKQFVETALNFELSPSITQSPFFDKMLSTVTESVEDHEGIRKEILNYSTTLLKRKLNLEGKIIQ